MQDVPSVDFAIEGDIGDIHWDIHWDCLDPCNLILDISDFCPVAFTISTFLSGDRPVNQRDPVFGVIVG